MQVLNDIVINCLVLPFSWPVSYGHITLAHTVNRFGFESKASLRTMQLGNKC